MLPTITYVKSSRRKTSGLNIQNIAAYPKVCENPRAEATGAEEAQVVDPARRFGPGHVYVGGRWMAWGTLNCSMGGRRERESMYRCLR